MIGFTIEFEERLERHINEMAVIIARLQFISMSVISALRSNSKSTTRVLFERESIVQANYLVLQAVISSLYGHSSTFLLWQSASKFCQKIFPFLRVSFILFSGILSGSS